MSFTEETIQKVWEKGKEIPGTDPNIWRKDECGATIKRTEYGNRNSQYGWEVDHIVPESKGGTDHLSNLQPLHRENNQAKSDNYPSWTCAKTN